MKIEKLLYHFYKEVIANSKAGLHAYNQNGKKGRSVLYNFFDEDRIPALSINKLRKHGYKKKIKNIEDGIKLFVKENKENY